MFDGETKTVKELRKNIVTTKKIRVRNVSRFVLSDNKSIIYK